MKKLAGVFGVLAYIGYGLMHIYFAYVAITSFKLWFALVVLFAPIFGDLLFLGACAGAKMWLPVIVFAVVVGFGTVFSALAAKKARE